MTEAQAKAQATVRGRTEIARKALEHLAQRCAAEAFGVQAREISVRVADELGRLRVSVAGPITVPQLSAVPQETIPEIAVRIQESIHDRFGALSGRGVTRVELSLTGAREASSTRRLA